MVHIMVMGTKSTTNTWLCTQLATFSVVIVYVSHNHHSTVVAIAWLVVTNCKLSIAVNVHAPLLNDDGQ